ncbi:MAG: hypothetical protein ABR566_09230 [Pyrinomonadaceae bacterium]
MTRPVSAFDLLPKKLSSAGDFLYNLFTVTTAFTPTHPINFWRHGDSPAKHCGKSLRF